MGQVHCEPGTFVMIENKNVVKTNRVIAKGQRSYLKRIPTGPVLDNSDIRKNDDSNGLKYIDF